MSLTGALLEILVCPKCKGSLELRAEIDVLNCQHCALSYPIREGMPVLIEDEALTLKTKGETMSLSHGTLAFFKVKEGKNKGEEIQIPLGTCKAIGRSVEDGNRTQMFHLDATVSLDDFTKKLILNYIAKKTGKEPTLNPKDRINLGAFTRLPDLILNDPAVSRLHAMIFHDESGAGILDLVSRNGTYVNGEEVESRTLKEGDLIEIGGTHIVFNFLKEAK